MIFTFDGTPSELATLLGGTAPAPRPAKPKAAKRKKAASRPQRRTQAAKLKAADKPAPKGRTKMTADKAKQTPILSAKPVTPVAPPLSTLVKGQRKMARQARSARRARAAGTRKEVAASL